MPFMADFLDWVCLEGYTEIQCRSHILVNPQRSRNPECKQRWRCFLSDAPLGQSCTGRWHWPWVAWDGEDGPFQPCRMQIAGRVAFPCSVPLQLGARSTSGCPLPANPPPGTWLSSSGSEHREQRWYSRSTLKSCLCISLHLEVVLLPEAVYLNRSLLPRQESQLCLLMFLQIQGVYRSALISLFFLGTASSNALNKQTLLYRTPMVPSKYILHKCI